ncbi:MAG TPA: nucleotidyltransferase domain-containing protein [Candidatus Methylomirabilis sp.]|nr:nucleotidyltransferase domain-containing protein [Candidatus Methylomirabilis sp.]
MTIDPRIASAFAADNGFALEPHLVVLALMGSHSHGTYLPPDDPNAVDDVDLMGFVVPPLEFHLGLPRWEHWRLQQQELDVVLYSLDKAFRLLLKSNPNIVGLLWLREEEYVHRHPVFELLRSRRDIFSSQAAAGAFAGYAYEQLKRMEAFDLERMAEYEILTGQIKTQGPPTELLEADSRKLQHIAQHWRLPLETLVRFRKLHREHFSGYMGERRKALVRKYQYDVKNAAHLIRVLRMGAEFLHTGSLQVYRTADADELKVIKRGGWSLEQVKAEAERLFAGIEQARARTSLPARPDESAANALLMECHRRMLGLTAAST